MKFKKEDSAATVKDDVKAEESLSTASVKNDNHTEAVNKITLEFNKKGIKTAIKYIIGVAFIILSLAWIINNDDKVSVIVDGIFKVLSPFIAGGAVAFVLNVLMRPLETGWDYIFKKRSRKTTALKRPVCLILSIVFMFGFLVAILFMIIPEFINTFENIIEELPGYAETALGWYNKLRSFALNHNVKIPEFSFNPDIIISFLKDNFANQSTLTKTIDFTASLITGLINAIVALAFSLYLLSQKEKLGRNIKKTLYAFCPNKTIDVLLDVFSVTDQTFTKFVSGQLLEALIIGLLCFVGMLIFNMPYAPVVSVLVGFTALIPVFGAFIGTAVGAFLILFDSPTKALWFIIFIIILQQLEGNLIYPKVVGKTVGLPGIWVLTAVTIGGNTFGVLGILLAVPACAVFYTILRRIVYKRLSKKSEQNQTEENVDEAADPQTVEQEKQT